MCGALKWIHALKTNFKSSQLSPAYKLRLPKSHSTSGTEEQPFFSVPNFPKQEHLLSQKIKVEHFFGEVASENSAHEGTKAVLIFSSFQDKVNVFA